jgi:hypothetical protein
MPAKRYGLYRNADGTWSVTDFVEGRVAEMHGTFLNRLASKELATELVFLLNVEEERKSRSVLHRRQLRDDDET